MLEDPEHPQAARLLAEIAHAKWISVELPRFAPADSLPNLRAKRIGNVFGASRCKTHRIIAADVFSAKGAVQLLAWGIAPGIRLNHHLALKARFSVSIPDITLIEIDAVPAQQLALFLLKRAGAMMLLLRLDVLHHSLELTRTLRQRTLASLPEKAAIASVKRFDPFRGCFLYLFD